MTITLRCDQCERDTDLLWLVSATRAMCTACKTAEAARLVGKASQ
jgi:uncharacterized paraquat-inducible protein A